MPSKAVKSSLWYTAGSFFVKGIGFITMPIFTRLMSQSDFGTFNTLQSWISVFAVFTTLELHASFISAKHDYPDRQEQYCLTLALFELCMAAAFLVLANAFSSQLQSLLQLDQAYIDAIFIYLMFQPGITLFQAWERYRYEYKKTVAISLAVAISTALLSVALVVGLENKLVGRTIGQVAPTALFGAALIAFFLRRGKKPDLFMLAYALPITLPLVPHALSGVALGTFDRVMISWWRGTDEVALYSVAYSCGLAVMVLATSMNQAFNPWLGDKITRGERDIVKRKSPIYIAVFTAISSLIMLLGPEIIWILGGEAYAQAMYVIPPVALGCMFQFLYTMYVSIEMRLKKTLGIAAATMAAAAINISLNVVFIPRYGYISAAYTTTASYGALLIFHYFMVRRLGYQDCYNTGLMVATAIGMTSFALLANSLYGNPFARIGVGSIAFIVSASIAYKKKSILIEILKSKKEEGADD